MSPRTKRLMMLRQQSRKRPNLKLITLPRWVVGGDEVGELTEQFCLQVLFAAAESKKLVAVHAELKLHNPKADSLDETSIVSRKE